MLCVGDDDGIWDAHVARVADLNGPASKPRAFGKSLSGSKARRALASYLRVRADVGDAAPLFARITGARLSYAGLRDIVRRRASKGWQGR